MTTLLTHQDRGPAPATDQHDVLRVIRDRELREAVLAFFDTLRTLDVEVYVMAARRLSCLYLSLVEAGMPALRGVVMTDRDLDIRALDSSLEGRRIALVDDTVIVGSTLRFLKERLDALVGSSGDVVVHAICIDETEHRDPLLSYLQVQAVRTVASRRIAEFSHDLAQTLFVNLVPYVGDYLMSDVATLSASAGLDLLESDGWIAADVTSTRVTDGLTSSYSMIPRPSTATRIRARLDVLALGLGDAIDVLKVRAYFRLDGNVTLARIVPLAMLTELSADELSRVSRAVARSAGVEQDYDASLGHASLDPRAAALAQFRFLQVVAATVLHVEFGLSLGEREPRFVLDSAIGDSLELNFGPALAGLIRAVAQAPAAVLRSSAASTTDGPPGRAPRHDRELPPDFRPMAQAVSEVIESTQVRVEPPEPGCVLRLGQSPAGFVAHFFDFIDGGFEKRERRSLREQDPSSLEDWDSRFPVPESRSLNRGVTLRHLAAMIGGVGDERWALEHASLCVDVCNDAGIVVPINAWDKQRRTVRRAFRVGENSPLAQFPFSRLGDAADRGAVTGRLGWIVPRFHTDTAPVRDRELFSDDLTAQERSALLRYVETTDALVASIDLA